MLFTLLLIVVVLGAYFYPLIMAIGRKSPLVGPVAVVDLFLGWTLIGWVVALVMAVWPKPQEPD